jgi:intein/homing endonuclease
MNCRIWFDENKYLINEENINNIPYFTLKLIKIEENYKKQVWDISVNKTHSFLANGIMVHNCFEPFTSNIYTRRTLAGEFTVVNKYLMEDLIDLDLWNEDIKDRIIYDKGSVKNLKIPKFLKDIYKTKVYSLANYINREGEIIPQNIITKAPTAELKPNQKDSDSLPEYEILDKILHLYIEDGKSSEFIISQGFAKELVGKVIRLIHLSEYKRRQSAPGPKISSKPFDSDWNYPISKS